MIRNSSKEKFEKVYKNLLLGNIKLWNKKAWKVLTNPNNDLKPYSSLPGNAYYHGTVGNGKTTAALWRLMEWVRWKHTYGKVFVQYEMITVMELLNKIKIGFATNSEFKIIRRYETVHLLLIDDIGSVKTTDWGYSILLQIINTRESMERDTIFTSNLSLKQLSEKLNDDRIPDRIQGMCRDSIYHFTGKSKR